MTDQLTIVMTARNAAATVERAVRSSLGETTVPLLLIDDHSADDTVARARSAAKGAIQVIPAPDPGGVAMARQTGLDHVTTPYLAWLDADDEWVPGRAAALVDILNDDVDVAVDAIDLYDGSTSTWLRRMAAPLFLRRPGGAVRLFERNFLPGDSQVGLRTSMVRQAGGYDAAIIGPESYDVLLRAIAHGARFGWTDTVGYRMHAYPGSLSRNLTRQREVLTHVLRKHAYNNVLRLYEAAGYDERIANWALVSMALYRGEPDAALLYLDAASPAGAGVEVLESDGPWPHREDWRRAFAQGAALLMRGDSASDAVDACQRSEAIEPTAEGANNLGVALAQAGDFTRARAAWTLAESRFPGYADARRNLAGGGPLAFTTPPLRLLPSRTDYR